MITLRDLIKIFKTKRGYKKARKKKGAYSFLLESPKEFFADLNKIGITYIVLRWPDSVPTERLKREQSESYIKEKFGDIDLMVDINRVNRKHLLDICAKHTCSHGISCEIYSTNGISGFCYKRFPYYPPLFAQELTANRVFDPRGFYRVSGKTYIKSLIYHLVYHKASAICRTDRDIGLLDEYIDRLAREAISERIELPKPLSFRSLCKWLKAEDFDMPYDLKVRWPRNSGLLDELANNDTNEFFPTHDQREYTAIFMLRDDIESPDLTLAALTLISEVFTVEQVIDIPLTTRRNVARHLRGGNWIEGKDHLEILPFSFVVCTDPNPRPPTSKDPAFPLIDNMNLRHKDRVRDVLGRQVGKKLYAIHGTDNLTETAYVRHVINRFQLEKPSANSATS